MRVKKTRQDQRGVYRYPVDVPDGRGGYRSIKCQDKMYKKYGIRMYINLLVECGFATGKIFLIL